MQPGSPVLNTAPGAAASSLSLTSPVQQADGRWMFPRREGFGAKPLNFMADKLWNERGTTGRVLSGLGAAHLYGTHQQARGMQKAHDEFADQHPVLSTLGGLMGVKRPSYLGALANRSTNLTNALGIL